MMAPTDGLFEPFHDVGEAVKEGDMAGVVHPVAELDRPSLELRFAHGGIVSVRRAPTLVARGDYLMQVAVEIDEATLYAWAAALRPRPITTRRARRSPRFATGPRRRFRGAAC
jgi:hypothetical protein